MLRGKSLRHAVKVTVRIAKYTGALFNWTAPILREHPDVSRHILLCRSLP